MKPIFTFKNVTRSKEIFDVACLQYKGCTIEGYNSNGFSDYIDRNMYHFGNGNEVEEGVDFYDLIKDIPILEIPNGVEFDIINIYSNATEKPLEKVPYPFNSLTFVKKNNQFFIRIYSYTDPRSWSKKWALDYYFSQFRKCIIQFPDAQIRENENEDYSEGRLKLEVIDSSSSTIDDALLKAVPIFEIILETVENQLQGYESILTIIEAWQKNKQNKKEEFWQSLFNDYPEIISRSFSLPFVIFQDKAYVGGKTLKNSKGNIIDFAYKNNFTNNVALIEIKTPTSNLISKKYRNSHSIATELSGSVNQLLKYKNSLLNDYYSIQNGGNHFNVFNPKCLLIIGSFENLNDDERETFELFRNELKTVEIITFDELFDKIYILFKFM